MNEKEYDFRNHTGTYQTGRTQPPKHYRGILAFLIVLVILLSGISTALSIMNMKLYWQLHTTKSTPQVAFSRTDDVPAATEAVHEEVRQLQSHLGISGTIIPDVYLRYYKLPRGIYVSQIANGSEAKEKGIVAGDIITKLDGHTVQDDVVDLWASNLKEGDAVELTIYRAGSEVSLTLNWGNFE